jgi:hypothetical protein
MNTKSKFAVLIALAAGLINTFTVFAHPAEQPYVTPLPQNQSLTCEEVKAQAAQVDTPMRKADYDILDKTANCGVTPTSKVHLLLVAAPAVQDSRYAEFKEMQADQLNARRTYHNTRTATPFADFKTQQAEQMGE